MRTLSRTNLKAFKVYILIPNKVQIIRLLHMTSKSNSLIIKTKKFQKFRTSNKFPLQPSIAGHSTTLQRSCTLKPTKKKVTFLSKKHHKQSKQKINNKTNLWGYKSNLSRKNLRYRIWNCIFQQLKGEK